MRLYKIILTILFVFLLGANLVQYHIHSENKKEQLTINSDFAAAIGRISAGLEEGKPPSIISLEHAFKASALEKYTTYNKSKIRFISILANTLRHEYLNNQPISHVEKIQESLMQLSNNPEDRELADNIILMIKKE
ncbi:hypothetical protein [Paenibacillus faecalis]|uniref:hypothetical protein n=1 Tax=Paenibacillus faecalis TaxID=2079532 RepID=UPI000D0F63D4|nr:hypothetical protein [Paenibacillus faecalis]